MNSRSNFGRLSFSYEIQYPKKAHMVFENNVWLIDIQFSAHALVITQALVIQFYKHIRFRVKKPLTQKANHFRTFFLFQDILHLISFPTIYRLTYFDLSRCANYFFNGRHSRRYTVTLMGFIIFLSSLITELDPPLRFTIFLKLM